MDDEEDMEDMMDEDDMMDEEMEMEAGDEEEEEDVEDYTSYTNYTPTKLVHTWRQPSTTVEDYKVKTFADYYDQLTDTFDSEADGTETDYDASYNTVVD